MLPLIIPHIGNLIREVLIYHGAPVLRRLVHVDLVARLLRDHGLALVEAAARQRLMLRAGDLEDGASRD